ncbi:hypothetical protein BH24DEI2_BH24DEI2_03070 [soil metagenome]
METVTFYFVLITASSGLLGLELALWRVKKKSSSGSVLQLPLRERYFFTGFPVFLGGVLGFIFLFLNWTAWLPWIAITAMAVGGYLSNKRMPRLPDKRSD